MKVARTREELRAVVRDWRLAGDHIALVPTMGNLHEGHSSLIQLAREHAERIVVSIFVNPTQFEPGSDYEDYPRTLATDKRKLKLAAADLAFVPDVETMYPFGTADAAVVTVPGLSDELCGAFRPGHFNGVTSVVSRLFFLVTPDVAVFGQKDYQQQVIIRRMTEDLGLPIEIVVAPTVREEDGLARSSRNQYLTDEERRVAPSLHRTLERMASELRAGRRNHGEMEARAMAELAEQGFLPDYVAIRQAENLQPPGRDTDRLVVLAAARLGKARLIDNILVDVPAAGFAGSRRGPNE